MLINRSHDVAKKMCCIDLLSNIDLVWNRLEFKKKQIRKRINVVSTDHDRFLVQEYIWLLLNHQNQIDIHEIQSVLNCHLDCRNFLVVFSCFSLQIKDCLWVDDNSIIIDNVLFTEFDKHQDHSLSNMNKEDSMHLQLQNIQHCLFELVLHLCAVDQLHFCLHHIHKEINDRIMNQRNAACNDESLHHDLKLALWKSADTHILMSQSKSVVSELFQHSSQRLVLLMITCFYINLQNHLCHFHLWFLNSLMSQFLQNLECCFCVDIIDEWFLKKSEKRSNFSIYVKFAAIHFIKIIVCVCCHIQFTKELQSHNLRICVMYVSKIEVKSFHMHSVLLFIFFDDDA